MNPRVAHRDIMRAADIDTYTPSVSYYPVTEPLRVIAHSETAAGCKSRLHVGRETGRLYVTDRYDTVMNITRGLGNREKLIAANLAYSHAIPAPDGYALVEFVARDESSFVVVSRDHGHTWTVCG